MNHLGVFAKYWQPGSVKTRLAAAIGNENAAFLYREFVRQTLGRHGKTGQFRSVWICPANRKSAFLEFCGDDWSIEIQAEGDLGQRMLDFFRQTLDSKNDSGIRKSVLIGSDSPDLDPSIVQRAFESLSKVDCVLGPSSDGGYYLIGMRETAHDVFKNVQWSSTDVFNQTVKNFRDAGLSWAQLPVWNDIDDVQDLRALKNQVDDIGRTSEFDQQLKAAITTFGIPSDEKF